MNLLGTPIECGSSVGLVWFSDAAFLEPRKKFTLEGQLKYRATVVPCKGYCLEAPMLLLSPSPLRMVHICGCLFEVMSILKHYRSPRKICDRKARCAASLQGVWAARPHTHKTALARKARAALSTAGCGNSFECLGSAWA